MRIVLAILVTMLSSTKHYYHIFSPFVKLRVNGYNL